MSLLFETGLKVNWAQETTASDKNVGIGKAG